MKRLIPVFGVLLIVALVVAPLFDATAQVKVKKIGRSLNQMTLPVKGSTAPAWNISTGLRAVGTKSRAYWTVDTLGSAQVGTPTWTLVTKPAGSVATLDSANGKWINSVKVDTVGEYIVSAEVGTQTAYDTIWASTYVGVATDANAGCFCHPSATAIKTAWEKSVHGIDVLPLASPVTKKSNAARVPMPPVASSATPPVGIRPLPTTTSVSR